MEDEPMLSTIDNPYSPFTQWDEWFAFDTQKGYHSLAYLARVACSTNMMGEEVQKEQIDEAIEEIVKFNLNGMYRIVYKKDFE